MTINSGTETSNVTLTDNIVTCADDDVTYQCFGTCNLIGSSADNTACGGAPNTTKLGTAAFAYPDCTAQNTAN